MKINNINTYKISAIISLISSTQKLHFCHFQAYQISFVRLFPWDGFKWLTALVQINWFILLLIAMRPIIIRIKSLVSFIDHSCVLKLSILNNIKNIFLIYYLNKQFRVIFAEFWVSEGLYK